MSSWMLADSVPSSVATSPIVWQTGNCDAAEFSFTVGQKPAIVFLLYRQRGEEKEKEDA